MKCSIMQPTYIPWLGYFDLIDQVDKFVFLDDVKFEKQSWHIRNRVKTAQGELFLTIPIRKTKSSNELMLNEAAIEGSNPWIKKHLKTINFAYQKSLHFHEISPIVIELLEANHTILSKFNVNFIKLISKKIGINTDFVNASDLKGIQGVKDARLVSINKAVNCLEYVSPQGAAVYIEKESPGGAFPKNNVDLYYHNYEHPTYNQLYGSFLPYMSIIDLLFNHGFSDSLEIIRSGRREAIDYLSFS
jgi:hypothetical protein